MLFKRKKTIRQKFLLFKKRPFIAVNDKEIFDEITNGVIDYNNDDEKSHLFLCYCCVQCLTLKCFRRKIL